MATTTEKPWIDWPDTDIEAGFWLKEKGYFQGYDDGTFRPNIPITINHFNTVLKRAEVIGSKPLSLDDKVLMKEAVEFLPGTVFTAAPNSMVTRYRLAVMLYRWKNMTQEQQSGAKLEQWFKTTYVTWNGVTRQPRLIGFGQIMIDYAHKYNVPIWLALGQCYRESQWFTTGLSINYNCGWGIKDKVIKPGWAVWGPVGNPIAVKGYTNYLNLEDAIHAYFKLMSSPERPYRDWIDKYLQTGDTCYIRQALNIYAPASENDTEEHYQIVISFVEKCEARGIK